MERYSRRRAAIIDVVTGNGTGQAEDIPEGLSATGARLEKSIASAKEFLDSINNADDLFRAASPLSSRTGQNRKPEAAGSLRASPDLEVFWDAVVQQEGKLARLRKANKNVTGKMEEALARLSEIGLEVEEDYLQRGDFLRGPGGLVPSGRFNGAFFLVFCSFSRFAQAKLVEDHLAHLRVERSRSISRDLFYTVMAYVLASVAFAFWFAVSVFNLGRRACAGLAEVPRRLKAYVVRSAPAGPSFLWTG
ncbi:MAG: hypothetical protein BJ554DRAFT_3632 [Olpidium bornovanus]|uniref:Uncharacterized protein n=1 Tax=Olpidium bornovanus TaxID=278681 RepID=A0A8H8DFJ1_9FUNG|nr:MAG: hypothetical protein BJ554DRAFT_3632 [Olpidium bornovanus]